MSNDEAIFAGTAPYYAKYRAPYPPELIADLVAHYRLDGRGRLLDLGCGPGTLTLPLAPHFESVLALDISEDMIAEAKRQPIPPDATIEWLAMRAEEISPALGTFRLVTCGSAFHWMDRDLVLARVQEVLEPGCGIALSGGAGVWWEGTEDWHQAVTAAIKRHLGERRRAGSGIATHTVDERFQQTLRRLGWRVDLERGYPTVLQWDADGVIGHLWSTSFANRRLLGDRAEEFERELRADLLRLHPDGRFTESGDFGLVCGRPPRGQV
jgi:trans-aconitate methyltransferase